MKSFLISTLVIFLVGFAATAMLRSHNQPYAPVEDIFARSARQIPPEALAKAAAPIALAPSENSGRADSQNAPFSARRPVGFWQRLNAATQARTNAPSGIQSSSYQDIVEKIRDSFSELSIDDGRPIRRRDQLQPEDSNARRPGEDPVDFINRVRLFDVFEVVKGTKPISGKDKAVYGRLNGEWEGQLIRNNTHDTNYLVSGMFKLRPIENEPDILRIGQLNIDILDVQRQEFIFESMITETKLPFLRKSDQHPEIVFIEKLPSTYIQLYWIPENDQIIGNYYSRDQSGDFKFSGIILLAQKVSDYSPQ